MSYYNKIRSLQSIRLQAPLKNRLSIKRRVVLFYMNTVLLQLAGTRLYPFGYILEQHFNYTKITVQ